jgi:trimethylamine:corrinoid methyltransferase-like protein
MDTLASVKHSINVLAPEAITRIHGLSLRILSEIGIRVNSAREINAVNLQTYWG